MVRFLPRLPARALVARARLLLFALAAQAIAPCVQADDLSGTWSASALQTSWAIGDWGKGCGPRPSGGGEKGGTVTLTSRGSTGFTLSGLGRNYSSGQCWEQMPGLSPRGKTLSSATIQTTCKMPQGDPRQATVVTSWYPRGDKIYFDETGQYQFVVSGSNCTASARRTRVLTRKINEPAESSSPTTSRKTTSAAEPKNAPASASSASKSAPTSQLPPQPKKSTHCSRPGKPTHLEATPRTKLMRPGENFRFEVQARDAAGCRVPVQAKWSTKSSQGIKLSPNGTLKVEPTANGATVQLRATALGHTVEVSARIVTAEEFEKLIEGDEFGATGSSVEGASVEVATDHVELEELLPASDSSKRLLLAAIALLAVGLGAIALYLINRRSALLAKARRQARRGNSNESVSKARPRQTVPASPLVEPTPPAPAGATQSGANEVETRLCPVCGRRYSDTTQFCVDDGARLMRSN